jgi:uncharacterized protein (DUF427 family)
MCRKLIYVSFSILVLVTGTAKAEVFSDDFETPHDYVADGAEGTGWDDFIGWYEGETVDALNASIDRAGQLYMESTNGVWAEPWTPLGPFLFKVVKGDFIATVTVTDYAGTADAPVYHNNCGLMARAYRDDAGEGEDWVAIDYFPIWTCGNFLRTADDNVRFENCHNGKQFDLDPYLQLERKGNTFHFRTSPDGSAWTEMICSPVTRDDFDGLPLMVGLYQATYSGTPGYVAFDDFTIEIIVRLKAYNPVPDDGAGYVGPDDDLAWSPGAKAEFHDVYLGTDFDDVSNADTSTAGIYRARQSETTYEPGTLALGTTYYWRIDEVNDVNIWRGDVWRFTVQSLAAFNPSPPDGAECVPTDVDLSWSPGAKARTHNVYFGTTDPPPFKGISTTTSYALPELAYDTLYYWRIDERNTDMTVTNGDTWTFRTVRSIPIADPNLVGWWKLDGVCGRDIVLDSSGYNHHGASRGNPQWVQGYDGGGLQFDGRDDYVELPIGSVINSLTNSTFATWVDSQPGGPWQRIFDFGNDPNVYMCLIPRAWFMDPMRFAITTGGGTAEIQVNAPEAIETGWHHVAVTINARTRVIQLYLDGQVIASTTNATLTPSDLGNTTNNWLGRSQYADDSYFMGSLDDFRIYDYAMSQADIERVMAGDPSLAHTPHPENGSTPDIEHATPLSWSAGDRASEHDVYFGTDETAVAEADTSDTTGVYRDRQGPTSYLPPETLQWGTTYYWRIDEYNTDETISMGRVWNFTVADYLVIDDFERYTDEVGERIFQSWIDGYGYTEPPPGHPGNGTGSTVGNISPPFAEQTIVHSGLQSMPFTYTNDGSTGKDLYSETERTFDDPQDWTRKGVKALTLWFYGDAANSAEPLYVAVQDSLDGTGVVTHPDSAVLLEARWQEWNIDLQEFARDGVDLSSIKTMYIGVGNRTTPRAGRTGTLYFDDIRLYRARCIPSIAKPDADLSDNCVVDYDDIVILAERWLDTGLIVTPADAGNANLVGHWKLDDGFGVTAADSSGNANDGMLRDDPEWVTGHDGGALRFDGTNDYVELPISSLIRSLTNSTFATWVNFPNAGGAWQRIFDFGTGETVYMFLTPRTGTDGPMRFGITIEGGGAPEQLATAPDTLPSGWHHVAVTINADNDTITLYLDGSVVAQNTEATLNPSGLGSTTNNWLGRSQYAVDAYYTGLIDDFRIYNRALTQAQVAWLAGRTSPFSIEQDLYQDGTVDLGDFAELADSWLQKLLWPQP